MSVTVSRTWAIALVGIGERASLARRPVGRTPRTVPGRTGPCVPVPHPGPAASA